MFRKTATALLLLALSAGAAQAWERVSTEAAFRALVVGHRQVVDGSGYIEVQGDGTVRGQWNGANVVGSWVWSDGYYCRNLRIGSTETGTNCQRIDTEGSQIRATNDRGQGRSTTARIE